MKPLSKILWRVGRLLLLFAVVLMLSLYIGLAWLGYFGSAHLIFHPHPVSYRTDLPGLRLVPAADGTSLAVLYLPNPAARHTLFYFHGNAEDLGDSLPLLRALHDEGFAVLAFDYRGYGRSGGQASEQNVYTDTQTVLAYARANLGLVPSACVVVGHSVGGGPAVELAAREPVAGLVLISPFTSAFRVVTRVKLLPFDRFDNLAKIGRVHCPVLIIHGTADEVIPFAQGQTLFAAANEPKRHVWIEGAGHNDIFELAGDKILNEIRDFEKVLPAPIP